MATSMIALNYLESSRFMAMCDVAAYMQFKYEHAPAEDTAIVCFVESGNCKIAEDFLRNEYNVSCKIIPIVFDTKIHMHIYSTDLIYEVQFELELHFASDSDRILYEIINPCAMEPRFIKK